MTSASPETNDEEGRDLSPELAIQNEALRVTRDSLRVSQRTLFLTTGINLMLAVATLVTAYLTYRLSDSTEDIRKSSRRQLRAYMVFKDVSFSDILSGNMVGRAIIRNVGQTPAYETLSFARMYFVMTESQPAKPTMSYLKDCEAHAYGTENFGGQESYSVVLARTSARQPNQDIGNFDGKDLLRYTNGTSALIIQGIICYKDIFNDRHYLKFCRYFPSASAMKDSVITTCSTENDYDRS